MEVSDLVFLKLGGSLVTDKAEPYTAREDVIGRLCDEIHEARTERPFSLLVGHGAGSFGHVSASRYRTHEGIVDDDSWRGFIEVREDAARLNDIVTKALNEAGEIAFSIQPSACALARARRIVEFHTSAIESLLSRLHVPVLYGDVCLDEEQGVCIISTEEIFRVLARMLSPARVILATDVEGVLDADGNLVPSITSESLDGIRDSLKGSGDPDVTGGMLHKVERALDMGVPTRILSGLEPGNVRSALLGETGFGTALSPLP
jgi:isopentenyl phosphate kinase